MDPYATLVTHECGPLDVGLLEVPVHQLVDRRSGSGRPPLVDLGKEACACLLRVGRSPGSGRDRLGQPDLFAGHRVDAGVHLNPQRAAGKRLHRPARSPPRTSSGTGHGTRLCHFAPHVDPRQSIHAVAPRGISHERPGRKAVLCVPPAGFEPATPALGGRPTRVHGRHLARVRGSRVTFAGSYGTTRHSSFPPSFPTVRDSVLKRGKSAPFCRCWPLRCCACRRW